MHPASIGSQVGSGLAVGGGTEGSGDAVGAGLGDAVAGITIGLGGGETGRGVAGRGVGVADTRLMVGCGRPIVAGRRVSTIVAVGLASNDGSCDASGLAESVACVVEPSSEDGTPPRTPSAGAGALVDGPGGAPALGGAKSPPAAMAPALTTRTMTATPAMARVMSTDLEARWGRAVGMAGSGVASRSRLSSESTAAAWRMHASQPDACTATSRAGSPRAPSAIQAANSPWRSITASPGMQPRESDRLRAPTPTGRWIPGRVRRRSVVVRGGGDGPAYGRPCRRWSPRPVRRAAPRSPR